MEEMSIKRAGLSLEGFVNKGRISRGLAYFESLREVPCERWSARGALREVVCERWLARGGLGEVRCERWFGSGGLREVA